MILTSTQVQVQVLLMSSLLKMTLKEPIVAWGHQRVGKDVTIKFVIMAKICVFYCWITRSELSLLSVKCVT